jgi:dsDNA-specific endonuclease/ATPase MutS2
MSVIYPNNLIYLEQARREVVIRMITSQERLSKPQIEKLIHMHRLLTKIEEKSREESADKEALKKAKKQVEYVYEKFNELFEMIKNELLI